MRIDGKIMPAMDGPDSAARNKKTENKSGLTERIGAHNTQSVTADAVVISGKGKEVSFIARSLKDLPDVREDKVAELKARIANGTYDVSGRAIAEKIVSSSINGLF